MENNTEVEFPPPLPVNILKYIKFRLLFPAINLNQF